ncbi:DUF887-domain-containing protein [Coprinellus micaceus]|uniref:DUF887-domain-containing protein n=1 Tax=Coprinellus micaceus TaxID=71717 RepID=A0A4Y7SXR5_COPMI|nr:DUF887-domain-containing protein [Coprinellus micaceus]
MSPAFLDRFLVDGLGLTKIPRFLPTLYLSFLGFTFVHLVLSPWLSPKVAPKSYAALKGKKARNNWSIHVVSQVHTLIIVPMSIWCIVNQNEDIANDRAFGWDDRVGYTYAIACGYFIWDTLDAIVNFIDIGFVIHGVACTLIYTMSFRPFVAYYGTRCLLWEISTFFLNIHWFLDKTSRTGTTFQLVNGFALLAAFFSVRLVYGGSISYQFFLTLLGIWRQMPWPYTFVFGLGNFALQGLNWLWFSKMIAAIRKRFDGSEERQKLINQQDRVEVDEQAA